MPPLPYSQAEFSAAVEQGFQASPTWHQGSIIAAETGTPGPPLSTIADCSWALSMTPKVGWGDAPTAAGGNGSSSQKATAGWLSMLSVFEPHWQVRWHNIWLHLALQVSFQPCNYRIDLAASVSLAYSCTLLACGSLAAGLMPGLHCWCVSVCCRC